MFLSINKVILLTFPGFYPVPEQLAAVNPHRFDKTIIYKVIELHDGISPLVIRRCYLRKHACSINIKKYQINNQKFKYYFHNISIIIHIKRKFDFQ